MRRAFGRLRFHAVSPASALALACFGLFQVPSPATAATTARPVAQRTFVRQGARGPSGEATTTPWLLVRPTGGRTASLKAIELQDAGAVFARAKEVTADFFELGATAELAALGVDRFGDGDVVVRLAQELTVAGVGRIPVLGRGASVRFDKTGRVAMAMADLADTGAQVRSLEADFERTALLGTEAASQRIHPRVRAAGSKDRAALALHDEGGALRPVYVVMPELFPGVPSAQTFLVDAHTGEVLFRHEGAHFAGNALVYSANPESTPNLTNVLLPIQPTVATPLVLENDLVVTKSCIDKGTKKSATLLGVNGSIHVCDLLHNSKGDANGDFNEQPVDDGTSAAFEDPFAEVSMYFHVTRAYAFFRGLQGAPTARIIAKKFSSVANLRLVRGLAEGDIGSATREGAPLETFPNAFYSPGGDFFGVLHDTSGPGLWFGQGRRRDYAYDGDVVAHEFTHAVVEETLRLGFMHVDKYGSIDAPGAMNEGLSDYFSSAAAGDPDVGEYAAKDASRQYPVIRTLANDDKCPTSITGETHYDSTLFSGGLWSARQTLPESQRPLFDAALYKAMRGNVGRSDLGYEDLVALFSATLTTDLPEGKTALETEMQRRGVLPECARILTWQGKRISAPNGPGGIGVFYAPGKLDFEGVSRGDVYPGIVQFEYDVPENVTQVTMSFTIRPSFGLGGSMDDAAFDPQVLVKADAPIVWTTGTTLKHDAPVVKDGSEASVTIDIPPGAKKIYTQIANGGGEASYDLIGFDAPVPKPDGGVKTTPAVEEPSAAPNVVTAESSCSCSTASFAMGGRALPAFGFGGVCALAFARIKRRRTR